MAKRRHTVSRQPSKDNIKGSSPDARQKAMQPGTKEYRAREALLRLKEAYGEKEQTEQQPDPAEQVSVVKPEPYDPSKNIAHDVAVRKFRRRRSKQRLAEDLKLDIDAALGTDVPIHNKLNIPGVRSMDEELYDDGVSEKDFGKDVVRDYEKDIKSLMNTDNNHDGEIDEDDITPALHRAYRHIR